MFDGVLDWLSDVLNSILAVAIELLPDTPFSFSLPAEVISILGYINWVVPFDLMSNTLFIWGLAVAVYYSVMVILRWAKAIE